MSLTSINGMGKVSFPSDGGYGSGDMPMQLDTHMKHMLNFSDFANDDDDDFDIVDEKSVMDQISNGGTHKSASKKLNQFMRNERARFSKWYKKRKLRYKQDLKKLNSKMSELEYKKVDALDKFKLEAKENKSNVRDKDTKLKYNDWFNKHGLKKTAFLENFDTTLGTLQKQLQLITIKFNSELKEKRIDMSNRIKKYRKI